MILLQLQLLIFKFDHKLLIFFVTSFWMSLKIPNLDKFNSIFQKKYGVYLILKMRATSASFRADHPIFVKSKEKTSSFRHDVTKGNHKIFINRKEKTVDENFH